MLRNFIPSLTKTQRGLCGGEASYKPNSREFMQQRRQWQRERQKSNRFRQVKQQGKGRTRTRKATTLHIVA